MTFQTEQAKLKIARIEELLRANPLSLQEVADGVHLGLQWARVYMRHLTDAGMAHICHYEDRKTTAYLITVPMYAWGPGKAAIRPKLTQQQRQERSRNNLEPIRETKSGVVVRQHVASDTPVRDPLTAMFFGANK